MSSKKTSHSPGIFSRLFGRKKTESSNADLEHHSRTAFKGSTEQSLKVTAGKNHIAYDSQLIDILMNDHKEIIKSFLSVETLMTENKFELATQELENFLRLLRDHVFEENFKLYGYLRSHDPDDDCGVIGMQAEMRSIQLTVKKYIEHHLTNGLHSETAQGFLHGWVGRSGDDNDAIKSRNESIKSALLERVRTEEKRLYPVYHSLANIDL